MKFLFIANRFCLDLVNTVVASDDTELDLLTDKEQVSAWLDLQDLSLSESMSDQDLNQLKELRTLIREWVLIKSQNTAKGLTVLNKYLDHGQAVKQLIATEGEFSFKTLDQSLSVQELLTKVATDFANMLVAGQLAQIKQCKASKCILVFLDTSKSKRRSWCSMKSCGNRAKASTFYQNSKVHH